MTRLIHLSDLHFGFHRDALVDPLLALINRQSADLVVVTGDLTHRGRPGEFARAAEFLERIGPPVIAVPGNHDVPLYNLPVRFLSPFGGYMRDISPDLAPALQVKGVRVQGLNSTDPFAWQRGVIREGEIGRVIAGQDPLVWNIVALHHPLQQLPSVDKELARRAPEALARLADASFSVVLSGHLHRWVAGEFLALGHSEMLQIQAGTALCARISDGQNEFAVLDFAEAELMVTRHIAPMDRDDFSCVETLRFRHGEGCWTQAADQPPVPMLPGATATAFSTA